MWVEWEWVCVFFYFFVVVVVFWVVFWIVSLFEVLYNGFCRLFILFILSWGSID